MEGGSPRSEGAQPMFETLSAVRLHDTKRSVPLGLPTFLVKADRMAVGGASNDQKHIHVLGDGLVLAEEIALRTFRDRTNSQISLRCAIDRIRAVFSDAGMIEPDKSLVLQLQPLVCEKVALIKAIANMFKLRLEAVGAIDFLREQEDIRDRVMGLLGKIFIDNKMGRTVDVEAWKKMRDGRAVGADHFSRMVSWIDLVRRTLPRSKVRTDIDQQEQVRSGFYGATEGGFHAGVIGQGGSVATYRGSETTMGFPSTPIIENMRELVELAIYEGGETDLAKLIHNKLLIDRKLDDVGLFDSPQGDGSLNANTVDPFTVDYSLADGIFGKPMKLPLLVYDGILRPVTASEFNAVVINPESSRIEGPRAQAWAHNLRTIAMWFNVDRGRYDSLVQRNLVSKDSMGEWLDVVLNNGNGGTNDQERKKKAPLYAPAEDSLLAGEMVALIAREVIKEMNKIKESGGNGGDSDLSPHNSNDTTQPTPKITPEPVAGNDNGIGTLGGDEVQGQIRGSLPPFNDPAEDGSVRDKSGTILSTSKH